MKSKLLTISMLTLASFVPGMASAQLPEAQVQPALYNRDSGREVAVTPVVYHRRHVVYRKRHAKRNTALRVGGGAAGGAAIGALAGGGKGAAIGALAGGGAGAIYDQHERHNGH